MNELDKRTQTAFEKVNPSHPDKIADRIAGALVDLAYKQSDNPKVAVELTIGHGECFIVNETSVHLEEKQVEKIVQRITESKDINVRYKEVPQDEKLAKNEEVKQLHIALGCGYGQSFNLKKLRYGKIVLVADMD